MDYVNLIGTRVNIRKIEKLLIDKHFIITEEENGYGVLRAIYNSRWDMAEDEIKIDEAFSIYKGKVSTPRPRYHAIDDKPRAFVAKEDTSEN